VHSLLWWQRALLVGALFVWIAAPASAETVQVRRALDGDSLLLTDDRQVRLIGINAPEMGHDGKPEQPLARAARTLLANLAGGQRVALEVEAEPRDRYGRVLAHVRLPDGRNVAEVLLRHGLVWLVAIPPNVRELARLKAAEDEARLAGRGVWNEPTFRPIAAENATARHAGFVFLTGRVTAVRTGRHSYFLELAPVVVLTAKRAEWSRYFDYPPEQLGRRELVVRGWLTAHDRELRMRLQHPAMLKSADSP
jgi:endonuclease YncB( thermonuclease family)